MFERAIFLNSYDYLTYLYYGNYCMKQNNVKKGLQFFRAGLLSYSSIKSSNYSKNYLFSNIPVIANSIVPNNLLYYISPDPYALAILKDFER